MTMHDQATAYKDRLLALLRRRAPAIVFFTLLMMAFDASRAWAMNDTPDGFMEGIVTAGRVNWILVLVGALAPYVVEVADVRPIPRAVYSVSVTYLWWPSRRWSSICCTMGP